MRSPEEVANALLSMYNKPFAGKTSGQFRISRSNLRMLVNTPVLYDATIQEIYKASMAMGLIVIELGDYFSVLEVSTVGGYRTVPKHIVYDGIVGNSNTNEDN